MPRSTASPGCVFKAPRTTSRVVGTGGSVKRSLAMAFLRSGATTAMPVALTMPPVRFYENSRRPSIKTAAGGSGKRTLADGLAHAKDAIAKLRLTLPPISWTTLHLPCGCHFPLIHPHTAVDVLLTQAPAGRTSGLSLRSVNPILSKNLRPAALSPRVTTWMPRTPA